ncbi:hypothetical protein GRAQ_02034 [Rahnella aquatilis CIP 78.65 = ATCC 33071]|nr:hypothetical protein GRAQ_02034 [Rahnella aquatilis CIP 78.65 = ATCC 33071]
MVTGRFRSVILFLLSSGDFDYREFSDHKVLSGFVIDSKVNSGTKNLSKNNNFIGD